jgi:hypothetical protein
MTVYTIISEEGVIMLVTEDVNILLETIDQLAYEHRSDALKSSAKCLKCEDLYKEGGCTRCFERLTKNYEKFILDDGMYIISAINKDQYYDRYSYRKQMTYDEYLKLLK